MSNMFWSLLACFCCFVLGYFLCAILATSKIADLESELMREKRIWKVLKMEDDTDDR